MRWPRSWNCTARRPEREHALATRGDWAFTGGDARARIVYRVHSEAAGGLGAAGGFVSVGGTGDPIDHSRDSQTAKAYKLYQRDGRSPWPHCGRYL